MPPPPGSELAVPRVEASPRRVRVLFAGKWIVNTRNAQYVWEHPYFPYYYFHTTDVASEFLSGTDLRVGERVAQDAVKQFGADAGPLAGLIKLEFGKMDAWFEEDERIYGHPKDPYKVRAYLLHKFRALMLKKHLSE